MRSIIREPRRKALHHMDTETQGTPKDGSFSAVRHSYERENPSRQGYSAISSFAARAQCLGAHDQGIYRRSGNFCSIHWFAQLEADRSHYHPGLSLPSIRKWIEQDFSCAIACGGTVAVSVAGTG